MEKHNHIIQLREVTYFPIGEPSAPQQPQLRYWQEAEDQEPWADMVWRVYGKPLLWHGFWFFFWFAMTILSGFLGIYILQGGLK